jgi:hypothetical protein
LAPENGSPGPSQAGGGVTHDHQDQRRLHVRLGRRRRYRYRDPRPGPLDRQYLAKHLTYNQAITALTLAERLATGHGDDDPFVVTWREELAGD